MSAGQSITEPDDSGNLDRVLEDFNKTEPDEILSAAVSAQEYIDNCQYLLVYERQMFLDMCHSDGLLISAKGISYDEVVVNLLKVYGDRSNLVLVINSSANEEQHFKSQLDPNLVHEVANTAAAREKIYLEGGIQFVSTRILVVDLLKSRIPTELVTGIIVLRAHDVIESCQEAFALRLFRRKNSTGFIKAFSRSAETFTWNYGHVEKVMRNMFLRDLYIWPRFHALIQSTLKPFEPRVTEFHVPMTAKMVQLQANALEIMNYLVKELKRLNPRLDMDEITVENTLTKNFHKILQAQLDCVWHQLSAQTKMMISDLKVLRSIMNSIIYNDCVNLFSLLRRYRTKEYALNNSGWVLLDASEKLFSVSRSRLFNDKEEFDPEWCPKWKPLIELLRVEIPNDLQRKGATPGGVGVLILCNDAKTCTQLNQFLTLGAEKFLFYEAIRHEVKLSKIGADFQRMTATSEFGHYHINEKGGAAAGTSGQKQSGKTAKGSRKRRPNISKAELNEFGDVEEATAGGSEKSLTSSLGRGGDDDDDDDEEENEDDAKEGLGGASVQDSFVLTMTQATDSQDFTMSQVSDFDATQYSEFSAVLKTSLLAPQPTVCIQAFKTVALGSMALERVLRDLNPSYVVMYHTDVTAIRQLEVLEARLRRPPKDRMNVFVLLHADTAEEQAYLTALRREKQAFELIIRTKQTMVIETDREGKLLSEAPVPSAEADEAPLDNAQTRQAGGQLAKGASAEARGQVVTDMREFRSELPCLIHRRGVEVVPVTITVGDYILTPDICVERKSISDLIGSLNSGRLYNQAVQMVRYYSKPVLLIEFDQNKPFHLQGRYMMSDSSQNMDVVKKLQLLTLHFPKLRLVWSASPYATAQLFIELKQGKPEPDPEAAALLGSDDTAAELKEKYNPVMYDFLLRLPGINPRNVANVLKKGGSLKDLLRLSEDELEPILGSRANAQMLHEILHGVHKPVPEDEGGSGRTGSAPGGSFGSKSKYAGGSSKFKRIRK